MTVLILKEKLTWGTDDGRVLGLDLDFGNCLDNMLMKFRDQEIQCFISQGKVSE
jgi:hypothetical protein